MMGAHKDSRRIDACEDGLMSMALGCDSCGGENDENRAISIELPIIILLDENSTSSGLYIKSPSS